MVSPVGTEENLPLEFRLQKLVDADGALKSVDHVSTMLRIVWPVKPLAEKIFASEILLNTRNPEIKEKYEIFG